MSGEYAAAKIGAYAMKRLLILLPLLIAACDGSTVRDTIGLSRKAPDEFRVIARPPLSVPPEFTLRPPAAPGEAGAEGELISPRDEAKSLMFGDDSSTLKPGNADTAVMSVQSGELESSADAQFLKNAGAENADPSIRQTLQKETSLETAEEKSFLEKLREPGDNESVVDAKSEAERLKANQEEGKPVTEGETPMAKPKDTGTLGRIFGY